MSLTEGKHFRLLVRLAVLLAMALLAMPLLSSACAPRPGGPDATAAITSAASSTGLASATASAGPASGTETGTDPSGSAGTGPTGTETGTAPTGSALPGATGLPSDTSASGSTASEPQPGSQTTGEGTGASGTTSASAGQPGTTGSSGPGTTGGPSGTTPGSTGTTPWQTTPAPSATTVWTSAPGTTAWTTSRPTTQGTTQAPATTQPATQATTQATTQPATHATTQATTQPTTTQGPSNSFPIRSYGTFFRNEYGTDASIVNSGDGVVSIDVGSSRNGVVLVRLNTSDTARRWKAILKGPSGTYQYDLMKRNAFEGVPLQLGNGSYTLTVYEQVSGTSYSPRMAHTFSVSLASSLSPYTASSIIVSFSSSSPSTTRASSLVSGKPNQAARIEAIYLWVVQNISYDRALASSITSGQTKTYIPNPDATMSSRKGICYDYAALMAAMLRSQGIPTRLIMGQVPQGYHAWNEVYIAGTGWVVIASFNYKEVDGSAWVMFDSTFAAGGMSSQTILNLTRTKERTY